MRASQIGMSRRSGSGRWLSCLALATALCGAWGADVLNWRGADNRVDADFENWPVEKVLRRVAAKTRWQVYLEPNTRCVVSAKFKDRTPGEALQRLLGTLNYALLPATNGPSRLYVFRDNRSMATQLVAASAENEGNRVRPNELVVTLKPGAKESIDELARRLGGKVVGRLDSLGAYRLQFADAAAAEAARSALATNEAIAGIDNNYDVSRPDGPDSGSLSTIPPLNLRPRAADSGSQVVVGLIDTAVQTDGTVLKDFLLPGISVAGPTEVPSDTITHGSGMAQTILYGLARTSEASEGTAVRILPIDVYGNNGSTSTFEIALGIQAAIEAGADVVNMSLGGDQDSPWLRALIQAGHQQGVVFVAAAGNQPVTTPTYPAAYPEVIAVTAATRAGSIASYANYGAFVDLAAPESAVVPFDGQSYLLVGTSTAAANVSAWTAAIMSATGKRGAEVESQVRSGTIFKPNPSGH